MNVARGSDAVQERVACRVAGLHPRDEDVPARAAIVGGEVERLRRPALEHLDVDPAALHRTVLEDCGDRRADVVRVPSGTTEGPRIRAFSRTSCGGLRLDELRRLVRDDLAGRDPRRVREERLVDLLHELGGAALVDRLSGSSTPAPGTSSSSSCARTTPTRCSTTR